MKLAPQLARKIAPSLALFVVLSAGGAYLAFLAEKQQQQALAQQEEARSQLEQAQARLRRAQETEQEIRRQSALFRYLVGRGILGEERRLDWVEQIREIKEQRRLLALEYEFAPQQPLAGDGSWSFYTSTMRLQMEMLHEDDLLNLLADLRHDAPALVQVRQCDITRLPRSARNPLAPQLPRSEQAPGSLPANLQAQCFLDWISIRESRPR